MRDGQAKMRALLWADAAYELVLAGLLVPGRPAPARFAPPAGRASVRTFGLGLVPFAAAIGIESREPQRSHVLALAAVNAAVGTALAGWLAIGRSKFDRTGA